MANSLLKDTTIDNVVGYEQIPAIPYRPALPARTVSESRNVCMFRYSGPGRYIYTLDPQTGQVTGTFVPNAIDSGGQGGVGGLQGTWSCRNEVVPVTYPPVPAQAYVPGRSVAVSRQQTGYNLGWNAGARSIKEFKDDGYVEFKVRASVVGVICGINFYDGIDAGFNGNTIDFAFYCARGQARTIRNGALGIGVGAYSNETVLKIAREGTEVAFYKDDVEVLRVTSGVSTAAGWLEASMYSGGDEVFDPKLVQVSPPDLTATTGSINAALEPLSMFASEGMHAELRASLPPLELDAEAGLITPSYAVGNFVLPALSLQADGMTGEVGAINAELEPLQMLAADHPYAELKASLPSLVAFLGALEGNNQASLASMGFVTASMSLETFLVVTMNSQGIVSATMASDVLLSADMLSRAALGSTFDVDAVLEAVMWSLASSGAVLGVPDAGSETWVINLTSQGTTTYSNFGFNSFAQIGTRFYGAGAQGIVELSGDTDDGAPIDASICLGELDFATALKKTVSHCYIGTSGEGHLYVKLIAEGREFVYKAESFSEHLRQHRVKFGKGLRENYVWVEIHNADGADFEVDTVEFHIADLTRRI